MAEVRESVVEIKESETYISSQYEISVSGKEADLYTISAENMRNHKKEISALLKKNGFYMFLSQQEEENVTNNILDVHQIDKDGMEAILKNMESYENKNTSTKITVAIAASDGFTSDTVAEVKDALNGNTNSKKDTKKIMEIVDGLKIALSLLGYSYQEDKTFNKKLKEKLGTFLYFSQFGIDARVRIDDDSFVLCKGSRIAISPTESCKKYIEVLRSRADHQHEVIAGIVLTDISFKTLSEAACFIYYGKMNGRSMLKNKSGKSTNDVIKNSKS